MEASAPSYAGFRFPAEIISHCVWLYHRFPLSLREVEEMMLQRGIVVSHETVRQWCAKFGQNYANGYAAGDPALATDGTSTALSTCSVRRAEEIIQCVVGEGWSGSLGWFRRWWWSAR